MSETAGFSWRRAGRWPTTSWSSPPVPASHPRRSSTSRPRPITSTPPRPQAGCAPPWTRSGRAAFVIASRDALKVPARALEVAFSSRMSCDAGPARCVHDRFCSPSVARSPSRAFGDGDPDPGGRGIELHTFFNVESIDPVRKVVQRLRARNCPTTALPVPPTGASIPHRLGAGARTRRLAADRSGDTPGRGRPTSTPGRCHRPAAVQGGLDGALRGAVVAERIAAAIDGRAVDARHGEYRGRSCALRDRGREGDAAPLRLRPSAQVPSQPVVALGKVVFNRTYWHTYRRQGLSRGDEDGHPPGWTEGLALQAPPGAATPSPWTRPKATRDRDPPSCS